MKRKKSLSSSNSNSYLLRYAGLGAQMLASIGIALFIGIKADGWLRTAPLFTIALPLLVLAGLFYQLIKDTQRKNQRTGEDKP